MHINKDILRRVWLVLVLMTVFGNWWAYHPSMLIKSPRPTQPPTLGGTENENRPNGSNGV